VDDDGVHHALWVIDDPDRQARICAAVDAAPVVIADGHHRYETALAYQAERRAARGGAAGDYDFVMALVVGLGEGPRHVGPRHRPRSGGAEEGDRGEVVVPEDVDLVEVFDRYFDLVHAGPADEGLVDSVVRSGALALVSATHVWLLTPREQTYAEADSDLDSSVVALATASVPGIEVRYVHDAATAAAEVAAGEAQAALFLRPVTVAQISAWAHARRRMPPKSTYFHPKPRTGMVFRPVED